MIKINGFTLIELLIVLAILGIISSIFISQTGFFMPENKLSSVTRDLVTNLRYAQEMSVNEQIQFGLAFFPLENKYQILRFTNPPSLVLEKNLPVGVSFDEISGFADNIVVFNAYGAASSGGVIILVNQLGKKKEIAVRPSGFVKIMNPND